MTAKAIEITTPLICVNPPDGNVCLYTCEPGRSEGTSQLGYLKARIHAEFGIYSNLVPLRDVKDTYELAMSAHDFDTITYAGLIHPVKASRIPGGEISVSKAHKGSQFLIDGIVEPRVIGNALAMLEKRMHPPQGLAL